MLFSFNQGAEWNALTLQTAHINTLYCQWREDDRPRHRVCIPPSVCVSLRRPELFTNTLQPPRFIRINITLIFPSPMVTSVIPTSTISSKSFTCFFFSFLFYKLFFLKGVSSGVGGESSEYAKVLICIFFKSHPTLDLFLVVLVAL